MTTLIIIRHGETGYNFQKRYCGCSDPSLNKKGIWQSEKLADRLKAIEVDKVYSSDLKRAAETSRIVFKNNSIEKLPDFREMHFGIFEGLRYDDIIKRFPALYRGWVDNPLKVTIPDGEALKELVKRVRGRLALILSRSGGGRIALVTHSGPIRIILCDALKFRLSAFWRIKQDTGALNIVDYPEDSSPIVVKMNDTSHLNEQDMAAI